jgi:hypothetical protein
MAAAKAMMEMRLTCKLKSFLLKLYVRQILVSICKRFTGGTLVSKEAAPTIEHN